MVQNVEGLGFVAQRLSSTKGCRQQPPAMALADTRGSSSAGFAAAILGLSAAVPELIVRPIWLCFLHAHVRP
jgi:hypothetical protein